MCRIEAIPVVAIAGLAMSCAATPPAPLDSVQRDAMLHWELPRPEREPPSRGKHASLLDLVERVRSDIVAAELIRADDVDPEDMRRARAGLKMAMQAAGEDNRDLAMQYAVAASSDVGRATVATRAVWMARADAHVARFQRRSLLSQAAQLGVDVRQEEDAVVMSLPALFAPGRADLREDQRALLDEIGRLAKWYRTFPVFVAAHTDSVGAQDENLVLSTLRAQAVVDYLTGERGVKPEQVDAAGYGESRPIADNSSKDGRARNRRVDITFLLR
jgi:outer membrane protein OmpA-like peptidoglycan-associated protein